METERVIFRHEYDPYRKKWGYLAIFPDDEANSGRYGAIPFHSYETFAGTKGWIFECYCEIDSGYMYSKKIIHKDESIVKELKAVIENQYDTKLEVIERINRRKKK